jgi:site-specific DNA-methyltransferase (adenine-specific)
VIDLRQGRWGDVLADVGEVDAVICDPPYGERTHRGNQDMSNRFGGAERRDLSYHSWLDGDVHEFVDAWAARCRGWMACMTDTDLALVWRNAYERAGRYAFAPVPVLAPRVRLMGDGPASAAVYLMVARPRNRRMATWGALPGYYMAGVDRAGHIGGKPLALMRSIVRDYSRPGDLVCDPCAGGATTLIAAAIEGRRAVGAELDPETFAKAEARIAKGYTPVMRFDELTGEQAGLL